MGNTEKKWVHKNFEKSDMEKILRLREEVFQEKEYGQTKWEWQYIKNTNGPAFIDLAVDKVDTTALAGHYAVISHHLSFKNEKQLAAQSLDTFTSSNYRRQGIFVDLAEKTYANATLNDIKYIFGFPNKASYPGFVKKLNFENPFGFNILKLPLRSNYYTSKISGFKSLGGIPLNLKKCPKKIEFKKVEKIPSDIEELCKKTNSFADFMISKSKLYLQWRYETCPDRKYSFFSVEKNNKRIGLLIANEDSKTNYVHLVDFICEDIDVCDPMISAAVEYYTKLKYQCMTVFTNESSIISKPLAIHGFKCIDKSTDYRFILRDLSDAKPSNEIMKSENWLILGGDTDFY